LQFWRLIYTDAGQPYWNMAVDETLFRRCQEFSNFPPTLRIYDWKEPAFTIGYFQDINQALNLQKAGQQGLKVVRRMTGGRAILHYGELTYAVVADSWRNPQLGSSLLETYRELCLAWIEVMRLLGIRVEYSRGRASQKKVRSSYDTPCFASASIYELTVKGKKLLGSAQRRTKACFIQQGSLPRFNAGRSVAFYFGPENRNRQELHSWDERGVNLESLTGRRWTLAELKEYVKKGFERHFGVSLVEEGLTQPETKMALQLEKDKYSRPEWNHFRLNGDHVCRPEQKKNGFGLAEVVNCESI
jgi:lipoate-protein ligase A